MIKMREKMFETNSSSTHSCVICSEKDFNDWSSYKIAYIVDRNRVEEWISKYGCEEYIRESFVDAECFSKIPLIEFVVDPDLFTEEETELVNKTFLSDLWQIMQNVFEEHYEADTFEEYANDHAYIENEILESALDKMAASCDYITCTDIWDLLYDNVGIVPVEKITYGENERYVNEGVVDGKKVVSITESGYN